MTGLVRSVLRHAEVVGLLRRELRQPDAKMVEVQPRHLFVEGFRQHRHGLAVLLGVRIQLQLRKHLVRE